MEYRVTWSPEAVEDLESIAEYIGKDSFFYAQSVISKILDVAKTLSDFPQIGRVVPEIADDVIRERIVYSYRLVYKVENEKILIVAVIHGRRLLENIGDRF
ncbi:MAG: type II toxin-antitoxin system RelE/ParE family toxin [Gammaproteobacteria bacterium]|jgi:addiction module RelE/StbE family toxin|nr:type II toxin-antitoxin system RelE/ParE family toxin [Gammaproteobacteria bacterium]